MTRAMVSNVLNYWMNEVPREKWFVQNNAIDAEIKLRFCDIHTRQCGASLTIGKIMQMDLLD